MRLYPSGQGVPRRRHGQCEKEGRGRKPEAMATPARNGQETNMDAYRIEDCIAQASVGMACGNVVRVEDGGGIEVSVAYGSVWVTQHNDANDLCLGAGESFRIDHGGATVVSALKPSLVTLTPPAAQAHMLRVSMTRAGTSEHVALFDRNARPKSAGFDAWLERYWARLFVPSSRPTTAAL
jgi:hypothetical protein